jgi:hypothetical protein
MTANPSGSGATRPVTRENLVYRKPLTINGEKGQSDPLFINFSAESDGTVKTPPESDKAKISFIVSRLR